MRFIIRRLYDDRIILVTGSQIRAEQALALIKASGRLAYIEAQTTAVSLNRKSAA